MGVDGCCTSHIALFSVPFVLFRRNKNDCRSLEQSERSEDRFFVQTLRRQGRTINSLTILMHSNRMVSTATKHLASFSMIRGT